MSTMSSFQAVGLVRLRYPRSPIHHDRPHTRMQYVVGPLVYLNSLHGSPTERSLAIDSIGKICHEKGFFQVINHGISPSITAGALRSAEKFFNLPMEEKMKLASDDITRPVRYDSGFQGDLMNKAHLQRFLLKQYSHPLEEWIDLWPSNPSEYREYMGRYAVEVRKVALEVLEAIVESLGLGRSYLRKEMNDGLQVMAVNGYPVHRNRELTVGIPPHSDYSIITIVLESFMGLEELDSATGSSNLVREVPGSLLVQVGDCLEVLSNGRYKGAVHRVVVNPRRVMRVSIARLHSFAMEEKVVVAEELVDEKHPKAYRESSFRGFLDFLSNSSSGLGEGRSYLDTRKLRE